MTASGTPPPGDSATLPGGCAAIVLAGGRAERMGGTTKPLLRIGDHTLLDLAITAATYLNCAPITAVGPTAATVHPVRWLRERPPFAGPAAAIIAGLGLGGELESSSTDLSNANGSGSAPQPEWTLVLAADLPRVAAAVHMLADSIPHLPMETDGVCLGDASSRPQWLIGIYRTRPLREAAGRVTWRGVDAPVREVMAELAVAVIADPANLSTDIDTWDDVHRERAEMTR